VIDVAEISQCQTLQITPVFISRVASGNLTSLSWLSSWLHLPVTYKTCASACEHLTQILTCAKRTQSVACRQCFASKNCSRCQQYVMHNRVSILYSCAYYWLLLVPVTRYVYSLIMSGSPHEQLKLETVLICVNTLSSLTLCTASSYRAFITARCGN
jgi:hypothetical protein